MGRIFEYICENCGYEGTVSIGPNMSSFTKWTAKVCNVSKEFVEVDNGFWLITKEHQKTGFHDLSPDIVLTKEDLAIMKAKFNKCPIHNDDDLSEIKYDKTSNDAICPKCNKVMINIGGGKTD